MSKALRQDKRMIRKRRSRAKVFGTAEKPRLAVFRSLRGVYAQVIDDVSGKTLFSASWKNVSDAKKNTVDGATAIGRAIAKKCTEQGIQSVVFDRSGYAYHGKVKAIADGAREGGLQI